MIKNNKIYSLTIVAMFLFINIVFSQEKEIIKVWEVTEYVAAPKYDSTLANHAYMKSALLFYGDEFLFYTKEPNSYQVLKEGKNFYNKEGEMVYIYHCEDIDGKKLAVYITVHPTEWTAMFMYPEISYMYFMNELALK